MGNIYILYKLYSNRPKMLFVESLLGLDSALNGLLSSLASLLHYLLALVVDLLQTLLGALAAL